MKISSIIFCVFINIDLTKILHVCFYIVSETEKIHHYVDIIHEIEKYHHQLCRHETKVYKLALLTIHSMYIQTSSSLSLYFVSYGFAEIAFAKLRHSRSIWGSLLHTYPQSLLYLTCHRRIITKCTVPKKNDPCCGNSHWNGLPKGSEFTIVMSTHILMDSVFISYMLNFKI